MSLEFGEGEWEPIVLGPNSSYAECFAYRLQHQLKDLPGSPFTSRSLGDLGLVWFVAVPIGMLALAASGAVSWAYIQRKFDIAFSKEQLFIDPNSWIYQARELDQHIDMLDAMLARPGGACFEQFWHPERFFSGAQLALNQQWKISWRPFYFRWKKYYNARSSVARERIAQSEEMINIFDKEVMDNADAIEMLNFLKGFALFQTKAEEFCAAAKPLIPLEQPGQREALHAKVREAEAEGIDKALTSFGKGIGKITDAFTTVAWVVGLGFAGYLLMPVFREGAQYGASTIRSRRESLAGLRRNVRKRYRPRGVAYR